MFFFSFDDDKEWEVRILLFSHCRKKVTFCACNENNRILFSKNTVIFMNINCLYEKYKKSKCIVFLTDYKAYQLSAPADFTCSTQMPKHWNARFIQECRLSSVQFRL